VAEEYDTVFDRPRSPAVLELVCRWCEVWLMRWTIDLDRPIDEQLRATGKQQLLVEENGRGTVRHNSPGSYYPASDGQYYRWTPDPAQPLGEGEFYSRREFTCPNGCPSNVQARNDKLDPAAVKALRFLHETRTPLLRMTGDKLLRSRR
jgi:hypothetical protein